MSDTSHPGQVRVRLLMTEGLKTMPLEEVPVPACPWSVLCISGNSRSHWLDSEKSPFPCTSLVPLLPERLIHVFSQLHLMSNCPFLLCFSAAKGQGMICNKGIKDKIFQCARGNSQSTVHCSSNLLLSSRKVLSAAPAECLTLLPSDEKKPFAFPMGLSPIDSCTPAVQMGFNPCQTSAKCTQTPHDKRFRCHALLHYVTLSHVLSPHTVSSQSSCVLVTQSLRLKYSPLS